MMHVSPSPSPTPSLSRSLFLSLSLAQDVVTRYAHQNGFHVERRFGWDCHGLPVEYEIDKTLGIKVSEPVRVREGQLVVSSWLAGGGRSVL